MMTLGQMLERARSLSLQHRRVSSGSEWLAGQRIGAGYEMTGTLAGTVYPVFVLGAHDPDDATDRVVP